jgi:hypothetical protein
LVDVLHGKLRGGQPNYGTIFLDDVQIHPIITLTDSTVAACDSVANGEAYVTVHGGYGPYTIEWSNSDTGAVVTGLEAGSYIVTVTDAIGCSVVDTVVVGSGPCAPTTITKTINTPDTYSGAPVLYTITACNNSGTPQEVTLTDTGMGGNFVATSISPAWPGFPGAPLVLTVPPYDCVTVEIAGYFTALGAYVNCVALETEADTLTACADTVTVRQNCPLMVSGTGDCTAGPVNLCMGVHSLITDIARIEFDWIYPNFLTPGALTALVPPSGYSFNLGLSSMGTPVAYDADNNVVHVDLYFTTAITSTAGIWNLFCLPFALTGTPPTGQNQFTTMVSGTHGLHHTDLYDSNGFEIHPLFGFMTQAANVILTGCPDLPNVDASFTMEVPHCGGALTVHGNLSDPAAIHVWTWGDDRTTPINGARDHTYDYFQSISMNTGWPVSPPIPPAAPGTYTITHTVIHHGVASSSTQQVTIYACCTATTVIPDGTWASSVGTYFTGTVDVQGVFNVDANTQFNNATVYMEPGAEIVVLMGADLRVQNSTLQSCHGVMWKSITATNGSTVRIKNCDINDAESSVAALDGSTVTVSDVRFTNNRAGIGVPDVGLPYNNVSLWLSGSTFKSIGTMPAPYPGQATVVGNVGYAAIDAHNTSLDLTAGDNVINGMSNGIVGHRSDLAVEGFIMKNVQPDATYAYVGNGAGIYAHGEHGFFNLKHSGYGMTSTVNFEKCRWGVYTEYMNVYSTGNNMRGMGTAYRVDRSGYMRVDILSNTVHTKYNGMDLRSNDGAEHILLRYNDITFGDDPLCVPCKGYHAIYVSEGNYYAPDSRILNNTILYSPLAASGIGIGLIAADNWLVAENQLYMADNALNRYGISTSGSRYGEISCNHITGASNGYPWAVQAAIRTALGDKPLISCNEMDLTSNGILFSGVTPNTDLRGNKMHRHKWALHLDGTAVIGAQKLKGNLWYDPAVPGGVGALHDGGVSQASLSSFWYNPATISGGNTYPPSLTPSTSWFAYDPGINYDCAEDRGEEYCSQFYAKREKDKLTKLDERVAADSLENDPYTDETKWMLAGSLYKKLNENPALLDSLQLMADFYDAVQGSATAAFKAIDDDQLALYDLDSTVVAQLQANRAQIEGLMALVKAVMEQLGDSTLTNAQRTAILAGISGYRANIATLGAWNHAALETARTTKVLTSDGVKAANAGIGTTELIESNQKQVNEIYLATVGKDVDTLTTAQASTLYDIASQCPMVGGNAVYKARSLYWWKVDDDQPFDDPLLCLPHGIIVKSLRPKPTSSTVAVVPNPAVDEATLVLTEQLYGPGVFVVFDAIGAEVMRLMIPVEQERFTFSTTDLAPAMYHYQVRGPSGLLGDGKLTIVR